MYIKQANVIKDPHFNGYWKQCNLMLHTHISMTVSFCWVIFYLINNLQHPPGLCTVSIVLCCYIALHVHLCKSLSVARKCSIYSRVQLQYTCCRKTCHTLCTWWGLHSIWDIITLTVHVCMVFSSLKTDNQWCIHWCWNSYF